MAEDVAARRARSREAHELADALTRNGRPNLAAIGRRLGVSADTVRRDLAVAPELEPVEVETLRAELLAECRELIRCWRPAAHGTDGESRSVSAAKVILEAAKTAASVGGLHRIDPAPVDPVTEIKVTYITPPPDHVARIEAARDVTPLADSEPS